MNSALGNKAGLKPEEFKERNGYGMKQPDVERQVKMGSEDGCKSYGFNNNHNPDLPAQLWFQDSDEGLVLFVVFYTQACRWSRCLGCNLPSISSLHHIDYESLTRQIDNLFLDPAVVLKKQAIRKVIISNNGSVLDEATFSSTALMYLMARLNMNLPELAVVCLETRPEYVDLAELEFIARALREGSTATDLELAIGFEAMDDRIRNEFFKKGLDRAVFERLISDVSSYGFRIKTYFMQKPVPGITDREAIEDIWLAIDYLAEMSTRNGVRINMHLNPTYVAGGTHLESSFQRGEYRPPCLKDLAKAALHAKDKSVSLYLGLYDEGLGGSRGAVLSERVKSPWSWNWNGSIKAAIFGYWKDWRSLEMSVRKPGVGSGW